METLCQSESENKGSKISFPEHQNNSEANVTNERNGEALSSASNSQSSLISLMPYVGNNSLNTGADISATDRLCNSTKNDTSTEVENGSPEKLYKTAEDADLSNNSQIGKALLTDNPNKINIIENLSNTVPTVQQDNDAADSQYKSNKNNNLCNNSLTNKSNNNDATDIPHKSNKNGNTAVRLELENEDHNSDSSPTKRADDFHSNSITQDKTCNKSTIIETNPMSSKDESKIEKSDSLISQMENENNDSVQKENRAGFNNSYLGKRKRDDSDEDRSIKFSKIDQCEKLIEEYELENKGDFREKRNDSHRDNTEEIPEKNMKRIKSDDVHENNEETTELNEEEMLAEIEKEFLDEDEEEEEKNSEIPDKILSQNTELEACESKTREEEKEEISEDSKTKTFENSASESSYKENEIEESIIENSEKETFEERKENITETSENSESTNKEIQAEEENKEENMEIDNETECNANLEGEKNIQDFQKSNVENDTFIEDETKSNKEIIEASNEEDGEVPLEQNTAEDDVEGIGFKDIVIGEAFTINEELMKEFDAGDELALPQEDQKPDEVRKVVPLKISTKSLAKGGSSSRKKSPSKHSKKYRRPFMFGNSRKKKKQAQSSKKFSSAIFTTPVKTEIELPLFLEELASIDPALIVIRDRYNEEGKKIKVHCIVFHETVLDWAMSETLLSSIENSKTLRKRLKLKMGGQIMFPENIELKSKEIYPVEVGDSFPFAMPVIGKKAEAKNEIEEEISLSFPLEQLCELCPSAAGYRLPGNSNRRLNAITFSDEPLEWAFKETFLSSFEDSPILSDHLGLDSSTKIWPDVTEEILAAHETIDYTFPFACPNSKKFYESLFFSSLSTDLPSTLIHETLQLSPLPLNIEKNLNGERDSLVRLLAVASFYKHSSCIPTIRTNRKLSSSHSALVESFRPLIISHANRFATVIREAREKLLVGVTCQNVSIIPAMIYGPIHCKRGIIFSNLQKLEAAVAKDPNNKLQNM